jgi:hypothetical protein
MLPERYRQAKAEVFIARCEPDSLNLSLFVGA